MPHHRPSPAVTVTALAFLVTAAAGCRDASAPRRPAAVAVVAGDSQRAPVVTRLPQPLVVRVTDASGRGVAGVRVAWNTASGQVDSAASTTDAQGRAATHWTIGKSLGRQTVLASVGGLPPAELTATGLLGAPARVTLSPDTLHFSAWGQTERFRATVVDAGGNPVPPADDWLWLSSNTVAATVDQRTGLVTATNYGIAPIRLSVGTLSATAFAVTDRKATSIALSEWYQFDVTMTEWVHVYLWDANRRPIAFPNPRWTSLDTTVATLARTNNPAGDYAEAFFAFKKTGTAIIAAEFEGLADTVRVPVRTLVSIISWTPNQLTTRVGESLAIKVSYYDIHGTPQPPAWVKWTSSDESVAVVSPDGVVRGVGPGTATIRIEAGTAEQSPGASDQRQVTVQP